MIKVLCDKCGKDCGLVAYDFLIGIIENPCPTYIHDVGSLKITANNMKLRFVVCQGCYRSFGFPNIHKAKRDGKLTWRDMKDEGFEDGN